jgi:DNA-binding NtrC family response regulator
VWPGNVRELDNQMRRCSPGGAELDVAALDALGGSGGPSGSPAGLRAWVEAFERGAVRRAA